MKHSTDNSAKAVNGETLSSINFGQIEKALYGLACCLCCLIIVTASGGCDLGTPTSRIANLLQSAPPLEEFDENNNYIPYKLTSELNTPRYMHVGKTHSGGLAFVFGGSDERGLSSLDTIEFFDQSVVDQEALAVETETGVWIDSDIEGNPIALGGGPRILHTVTELPNGRFIIIGGSDNLAAGTVVSRAEIFDPNTRQTEFVEGEMFEPRFRHRVTRLPAGNLLITGGQIFTSVTVINPNVKPGTPGAETQEARYPSTRTVEYYSPNDSAFLELTLRDSASSPARLASQRGRADHCVGRLAGPDKALGGSDDMYIVTAGMETLSAVSGLAPDTKFSGAVGRGEADGKTSIEVFDPGTNIFTLISSVKLDNPRLDKPYAINLGQYNDYTPDGVRGMGNSILITHGNSDGICPITPFIDQLFIASFTPGAGPARGIRFFEVTEEQYYTHIQHMEYPGPTAPAAGDQVARCSTNPVALPREFPEAVHPQLEKQIWVFSLAGVDIYPVPGGCVYNHNNPAMLAGCVFDPFFNVPANLVNNLSPRDLANQRRTDGPPNYLGIVGAWFTIDGNISAEMTDWGTTSPNRWPENKGGERCYVTCLQIGGVDGIIGTYDDRILLAGGGKSYGSQGGEPTSPSAEVFLPPGSSEYNED
jgi:hypothetical protein